jgi:hypothetical protein
MEEQVVLFISAVTDEFRTYRDAVARALRRPGVSVEVQEDFIASGDTSLLKLDYYIQRCDAIIHLVGDATGRLAREPALADLRRRYPDCPRQQAALGAVLDGNAGLFSYTQWEAYLAVLHDKMLFVCVPEMDAPREPGFVSEAAQGELQRRHLARLRECGRYPEIAFSNSDKLIINLLRSSLEEKIRSEIAAKKFRAKILACWSEVEKVCEERKDLTSKYDKHADDSYYQEREIEKTFREFVQSQAKGMIIVGESGMGKTTLLVHLVSACLKNGDLCAMFNSGEFPSDTSIGTHLANELGRSKLKEETAVESFWSAIDEVGKSYHKQVLVFIDAINEYNPRPRDRRPVDLMKELDKTISDLSTRFGQVKFVVTCRADTWARAIAIAPTCFRGKGATYFTPSKEEVAWTLSKFSPEEFQGAYENYRKEGRIETEFEQLSPLAKHHLRDPFILRIAHEAYANGKIPRELDTGELFGSYYDDLGVGRSDVDLHDLHDFIDRLIDEMFGGDACGEAIQRTAFPRNRDLEHRKHDLFEELNFSNRGSLGFEARQKNVIRTWKTLTELGEMETQIRFTYDRFAEYLLAKRLWVLIHSQEKTGKSLPQSAKSIFKTNLPQAQRDPVVHGALRLTLSLICKEIFGSLARKDYSIGVAKYVAVLKAISEIDARGQWLVSSALAQIARSKTGGIELLQEILKQLGKGRSSAGRRFPVIESVYRVLKDEDYRLWLHEQKDVQQVHLNVLYDHFVRAFQDANAAISAAAIQYVFFLWKDASTCDHGLSIANHGLSIASRLAGEVKPPLQMALSWAEVRRFCSLATLMILVLSEAPNERFSEAVKVTEKIVSRLELKKFQTMASLLMNTFLVDFFLHIIDQLPNPVQLDALKRYFNNRDEELAMFEEVLGLLDPKGDPSKLTVQTLKRLSQTDNSFVAQMLTFVISVNFERAASPEARARMLALADDMFFEEPRSPISEYCSSLALYHINFFGRRAGRESMRLMDRMASSILSEREGRFKISGKDHSFNIIGTYGRSLHKYHSKDGIDVEAMETPAQSAMQYATNALTDAKKKNNAEFYLYICKELGLLGVLVQPKYLFDVFTSILDDVNALDRPTIKRNLRFAPEYIERAKETILQSLTNIRVLYRQQVDEYLLDVLERPEIYAEIETKRIPDFRLPYFMSWAFEQLTFRCLAYHYEMIGKEFMRSLLDAARCGSPRDCMRTVLARGVKLAAELAPSPVISVKASATGSTPARE